MLTARARHAPHPELPRRLAGRLRPAGLELDAMTVRPIVNTAPRCDSFGIGIARLTRAYLASQGLRAAAELESCERGRVEAEDHLRVLSQAMFACHRPPAA